MNDKILHLSFAMGGGVSLGAFSGTALTEAVKMICLFGGYSKVQIDSFSGASAGSISLGIMLRYLLTLPESWKDDQRIEKFKEEFKTQTRFYLAEKEKDNANFWWRQSEQLDSMQRGKFLLKRFGEVKNDSGSGDHWQSWIEALRTVAIKALSLQFVDMPNVLLDKSSDNFLDVLAIQVVQEAQRFVWCHQLHMSFLIPNLIEDSKIRDAAFTEASLLSRSALLGLIKWHLLPHDSKSGDAGAYSGKRLLGDRILFASSLSSLQPLIADARPSFHANLRLQSALSDAMTSRFHRDGRVFDIRLSSIDRGRALQLQRYGHRRWHQMQSELTQKYDPPSTKAPPSSVEMRGEFPDRWFRAHIPYEVGNGTQDSHGHYPMVAANLKSSSFWSHMAATCVASGSFPGAFEPVLLNRKWWEYDASSWPGLRGSEEIVLPFADGGIFVNEPVRQAFRLASHLDSLRECGEESDGKEAHHRLVLFVDPNVSSDPDLLSRNMDWLAPGSDVKTRLTGALKGVVAAVMDESQAIELNKVDGMIDRLNERACVRDVLLDATTLLDFSDDYLHRLMSLAEERLDLLRRKEQLPTVGLNIFDEVTRVIQESNLKEEENNDILAFLCNLMYYRGVECSAAYVKWYWRQVAHYLWYCLVGEFEPEHEQFVMSDYDTRIDLKYLMFAAKERNTRCWDDEDRYLHEYFGGKPFAASFPRRLLLKIRQRVCEGHDDISKELGSAAENFKSTADLAKFCLKNKKFLYKTKDTIQNDARSQQINSLLSHYVSFIVNNEVRKNNAKRRLFSVVMQIVVDLISDMEGKSRSAQMVGIAPLILPRHNSKRAVRVDMPAGEVMGFAGFMSRPAARHAAAVGVLAAHHALQDQYRDILPSAIRGKLLDMFSRHNEGAASWSEEHEKALRAAVNIGTEELLNRGKSLLVSGVFWRGAAGLAQWWNSGYLMSVFSGGFLEDPGGELKEDLKIRVCKKQNGSKKMEELFMLKARHYPIFLETGAKTQSTFDSIWNWRNKIQWLEALEDDISSSKAERKFVTARKELRWDYKPVGNYVLPDDLLPGKLVPESFLRRALALVNPVLLMEEKPNGEYIATEVVADDPRDLSTTLMNSKY